jgi:hypothetical protein
MNEVDELKERIALLQGERRGTYEVRFDLAINKMVDILREFGRYKPGPPPESQFFELFNDILEERNKAEKWAAAECIAHRKTAKQFVDMKTYADHLEKKANE